MRGSRSNDKAFRSGRERNLMTEVERKLIPVKDSVDRVRSQERIALAGVRVRRPTPCIFIRDYMITQQQLCSIYSAVTGFGASGLNEGGTSSEPGWTAIPAAAVGGGAIPRLLTA